MAAFVVDSEALTEALTTTPFQPLSPQVADSWAGSEGAASTFICRGQSQGGKVIKRETGALTGG